MTQDRKITMTDAMRAGYCVSGIRDYIRDTLKLDVRDAVKNGIPASLLENQDDEIGRRILELKNWSQHGE